MHHRLRWSRPVVGLLFLLGLVSCTPPDAGLPDVAVFARHYLDPIFRETPPLLAEVGQPLALAATPGEFEPASLGVWTRLGLTGVRVEAGPLKGARGGLIDKEQITVAVTRYIPPLKRWPKLDRHPLQPGYLDPARPVDIAAGQAQQFWITVRVPENAAPETYTSELTVSASGMDPVSVPLTLEVYPFRLAEPKPGYFVYGDNYPLSEEVLQDSRDHGMTTICVNPGWIKQVVPVYKDGQFTFPEGFPPVVKVVETARKLGMGVNHPIGVMLYQHLVRTTGAALKMGGVPRPAGLEDTLDYNRSYSIFFDQSKPLAEVERFKGTFYTAADPYARPTTDYGSKMYDGWIAAMKNLDRLALEKGWPPLWYYLIDEPHQTRGSMRLAVTMVTAAAAAGADAMITCNEPTVSEPDQKKWWYPPVDGEPGLRLEPFLKTRCYHNRYLGPETEARTREAGDRYGTYINIYGNQPASVRYQAGFLAWRLGLDLVMFWSWEGASAEGEGGRRVFLREWEASREGVDDLRYLQTLEEAIAAGKGSPAARAEAQKVLAETRAAIVPNVKAIGYVDGNSGEWIPGDDAWPSPDYDTIRRKLARALASLM